MAIQTDKQLLDIFIHIIVVYKNLEISAGSNISKEEHDKVVTYQWLKDRWEQMWNVECKVVPLRGE